MAKQFDFNQNAKRRAEDQERIQAKNNLTKLEACEKRTKERVNFSLYPDSKDKLFKKAEEMNISASSLIEILIQENC